MEAVELQPIVDISDAIPWLVATSKEDPRTTTPRIRKLQANPQTPSLTMMAPMHNKTMNLLVDIVSIEKWPMSNEDTERENLTNRRTPPIRIFEMGMVESDLPFYALRIAP